jgi:GNAT superfamily N-acetyltransferase
VLPASVTIRPATAADGRAVLELVARSFETYRTFAPEGWEPPIPDDGAELMLESRLVHPDIWYVVAEDDRGHAGQCGISPGHERRNMQGPAVPGLAHFWQLFVRQDHWGSGLADELHRLSVDAMRERGYERARLLTPAGQARARRFYERRGWRLAPISVADPADLNGLEVVEYRLELQRNER